MSNKQPEVNIGLVGHVDHGKTTLTERLSGKWTDTHSEELKRGITIKLGYADTTFYKDKNDKYTIEKKGNKYVRKISFVDAPGHESLMATMLSGATVMDGAILLVSANEDVPQPQTIEHLMALRIAGIENVIVAQNKIDLVDEKQIMKNYKQITKFLKSNGYDNAPIIPISAQHGTNIHYLIEAIEKHIPTPNRDEKANTKFVVARSFDINKPGDKPKDLKGGILGGALVQGALKVGDRVEIRPGMIVEERNKMVAKPLFANVTNIQGGGASFDKVTPGGSIGVMTDLDPAVVKSDSLTGNLVGHVGKLPPTWYDLTLKVDLLERVVGSQGDVKVEPLKENELLMLNVNSAATVGKVVELGSQRITVMLKLPVCASVGSRVSISRRVGTRFRLIGFGLIEDNENKEE